MAEIVLIYSYQGEEVALVLNVCCLLLFGCMAWVREASQIGGGNSRAVHRHWNIIPGLSEQGE
jgi:hypothetical protein